MLLNIQFIYKIHLLETPLFMQLATKKFPEHSEIVNAFL